MFCPMMLVRQPKNAFLVCTFWYINALAALGQREEARALFERMPLRGRPCQLLDPGRVRLEQ